MSNFLAMTYSFSNSTVADATQVNTNLQDVVDATSDGTNDFNILGITAAGAATLNHNVTLGASSARDLVINANLASTITIKTNSTYGIGSATLGLSGIYFGGTSTFTTRIVSGATASYTITLPTTVGVAGQVMQNSGSGTMVWVHGQTTVNAVSSAAYAILDNDGYSIIDVTTGSSDRAITLPAAANNTGRVITIRKVDTGTGAAVVTGTVNGQTNVNLAFQYDQLSVSSDGSAWTAKGHFYETVRVDFSTGTTSFTTGTLSLVRLGKKITIAPLTDYGHGNSNSPTVAGVIPARFRPPVLAGGVQSMNGSVVRQATINTSGDLSIAYRDWAGTLTSQTAGSGPNMVWHL